MRVLHVAAYYAPAFVYGGPPRSIHALCRALRGAGVDVDVFTTDANGDEALPTSVTRAVAYERVPVRYFPRTFPRSPIGSRFLSEALSREVRGYDLVHLHGLWNRAVWSAAREARRAGIPYVLSPRGMLQRSARAHRGWRKRAAWMLLDSRIASGAALLHATSEHEREALLALRGRAPVVLIPNGVDLGPPRQHSPTTPLIVFVGRVHPIKRVDLLIDAFASLRECVHDVKLAIAGPDESGLKNVLAERAGRHAEAVSWMGEIDEAQRHALLARASALVMCSDSESFGMSVLEAMAAAVPVVVTKTCPWPDVERHETGYWVDQTSAAMCDALLRILQNPDSALQMGQRGRALAERTYRWDAIARMFVTQYRALQDRAPARAAIPAIS